jgi:hypothetical protein
MGVVAGRRHILSFRALFLYRENTFVRENTITVVPNNDICMNEFPNVVTYLYFDVFFPLIALSERMMEQSVRPHVSFQTT